MSDTAEPRASVVIAALNAADTIGDQLAALAAQEVDFAFEVIVADNGSTDATREVVERWADRVPGLRVIDASARRGAGYARNCGAGATSGWVIAFCDADDEVAPSWLDGIERGASKHGLSTGPVAVQDAPNLPRSVRRHLEQPFGFLPTAPTANLGVRRDLFEELGGFTTKYHGAGGEDADLCWRAQLAGAQLAMVADAFVEYRTRSTRRERLARIWHYEQCNALLYVDYRDRGMQREPLLQPARRLAWILTHPAIMLRSARHRDLALKWLVQHASRAWASVRLRIVFP